MIVEICLIIIAIASCVIAVRLHGIMTNAREMRTLVEKSLLALQKAEAHLKAIRSER